MTSTPENLRRIAQFGAIKLVPGLFNLLLIPYLFTALGASGYGTYSLLLGYALLIVTVTGAIVTQPMYRFLASHPQDLAAFNSFAVALALAGGIGSLVAVLWLSGRVDFALTFTAAGFSAVLFAATAVRLQVEGRIGRLAMLEAARVGAFLAIVLTAELLTPRLLSLHAIAALAASFLVPVLALARPARFAMPRVAWIARTFSFGAKSATWLALAGLPVVAAKTLLAADLSAAEFGAYTALADLTYRGFGLASAAVVMWVFPAVSKAYDTAAWARTRQLLRFAGATYAVLAATGLCAVAILCAVLPEIPAGFSGGVLAVLAICLAQSVWQGMALAHKPLELRLQTGWMVALMIGALAIFALSVALLRGIADPVLTVSLSMALAGAAYISACLTLRNTRSGATAAR